MATILITGANRGIGLEFTRQYLADGWHVIATCRQPEQATALQVMLEDNPSRLQIHQLDVTDHDNILSLAQTLSERHIDILLNNAGVYGPHGAYFGKIPATGWELVFQTNTVAPVLMAQAFINHVQQSQRKIIASISTEMASITDNTQGRGYIYRASKAALNAAMKSLSIDLIDRDVTTVLLNPGWVRTDMGGPDAKIEPEDSVARLRDLLSIVTSQENGRFLSHDGAELPW